MIDGTRDAPHFYMEYAMSRAGIVVRTLLPVLYRLCCVSARRETSMREEANH